MQSSFSIRLLEDNASLPTQEQVLERFRRLVIERNAAPAAAPTDSEDPGLEAESAAVAAILDTGDSSGPEDSGAGDSGAEAFEEDALEAMASDEGDFSGAEETDEAVSDADAADEVMYAEAGDADDPDGSLDDADALADGSDSDDEEELS